MSQVQMPFCGGLGGAASAQHADTVGVNPEPVFVLAEPAHGGFAVPQVLGPDGAVAAREFVVDAHADVAVARERAANVDLAFPVALAAVPAAAISDATDFVKPLMSWRTQAVSKATV